MGAPTSQLEDALANRIAAKRAGKRIPSPKAEMGAPTSQLEEVGSL